MTLERTIASPYRTNVRPREIRASSWRNVVIASYVVAGLLGISGAASTFGNPYEIHCNDDATTVLSWGPDRKRGTADDITFPDDPRYYK
jgi:hypothetical protein